jgi:hypothetical protein
MDLSHGSLLRRMLLIGTPLAYAVLLLFHPLGEGSIYHGVHEDVVRWQVVHVGQLFFIGLIAAAIYMLLDGLTGLAATISRAALIPFVLFYGAFEAVTGIGTGVLIAYVNDLPESERAIGSAMIDDYFENRIAGNLSMASGLGTLAWLLAMGTAALAYRRAGAPISVIVLLGLAAVVFGISHPPPFGPIGMLFFAAAAFQIERTRRPRIPRYVPVDPAPAVGRDL